MLEPLGQRAVVVRDACKSAEADEPHPAALELRFAAGLVSADIGDRSRCTA
jgi:nicotinamidase-related amidase